MSIPKISTFDFEQLSYSSELKTTRAGGKCAQVGYGAGKVQVKFQLGDSMREALLCKWGADYASREEASAAFFAWTFLDFSSLSQRMFQLRSERMPGDAREPSLSTSSPSVADPKSSS